MKYLGTHYITPSFDCIYCGRDLSRNIPRPSHVDACEARRIIRELYHYREFNSHIEEYVLR